MTEPFIQSISHPTIQLPDYPVTQLSNRTIRHFIFAYLYFFRIFAFENQPYSLYIMKKTILLPLFLFLFTAVVRTQPAKYIFYFIGDGMGPNAVLTAEMYLAECNGQTGRDKLCMTQLPYSGQAATFSASNGITDSSAAGTCLATGKKTTNGTLGLTPDGQSVPTIAEQLKAAGWGVGITTSVSIDHATPAAFYAHVSSRNDYYEIGTQLFDSDFDFFAGATFYKPLDSKNTAAPSLYRLATDKGYTIAHGYTDYQNTKADAKKMILIQEHEGHTDDYKGQGKLPYAIDKNADDLTLPQITEAAIEFLSRNDRFFLMVEGGAIDWACHGNDGATIIREVTEFDQAIRTAFEFYLQHPDETLIVITADHETGGLSLGNSDYTLNLQILQNQKSSASLLSDNLKALHRQYGKKLKWEQVKGLLQQELGFYTKVEITKEEDAMLQAQFKRSMSNKATDVKTLYKELSGLSDAAVRLLNKKAKLGWTTTSHSAAAVPVFAVGAGAEQFTGWHDNSELAPMILKAAGQ